jgi:hypothetical protein
MKNFKIVEKHYASGSIRFHVYETFRLFWLFPIWVKSCDPIYMRTSHNLGYYEDGYVDVPTPDAAQKYINHRKDVVNLKKEKERLKKLDDEIVKVRDYQSGGLG